MTSHPLDAADIHLDIVLPLHLALCNVFFLTYYNIQMVSLEK